MSGGHLPPLRDRPRRVGLAVVGIGLLSLVAAPVVAVFASAAIGSEGEVRVFLVRALVVWLGISTIGVLGIGFWLWWGWGSDSDSIQDEELS